MSLADLASSNGTFIRVNGERPIGHASFVLPGQQRFRLTSRGGARSPSDVAHRVACATRGRAAASEVPSHRLVTAQIISQRALVRPLQPAWSAMRDHGEATRRPARTRGVILGVSAGTGAAIARSVARDPGLDIHGVPRGKRPAGAAAVEADIWNAHDDLYMCSVTSSSAMPSRKSNLGPRY